MRDRRIIGIARIVAAALLLLFPLLLGGCVARQTAARGRNGTTGAGDSVRGTDEPPRIRWLRIHGIGD